MKTEITEEVLSASGFKYDPDISDEISFKINLKYKDNYVYLKVAKNKWTNWDTEWYCHIDNDCFESIGWCYVKYVEDINALLKILGVKQKIYTIM